MKLIVKRGDKELGEFEVDPATDQLEDLQKKFCEKNRRYSPERCRFTIPSQAEGKRAPALEHYKPLSAFKLKDREVLQFKDMGIQVPWRIVYLIEYLGPLVIFPLFALQPSFIYPSVTATTQLSPVQWLALGMWTLHFVKRELETLFVHDWGKHATLPLRKIPENSTYYWGFALFVAYFVFHPLYTPPQKPWMVPAGAILMLISEGMNFYCHKHLASLRPKGTRVKKEPTAWPFLIVSCPNYTFEVLSWVGFNLMTSTMAGILFNALGLFIMSKWAKQRHDNYVKLFTHYPASRAAIIPYVY